MSICKIKDCNETALIERGRYARLCKVHRQEHVARRVKKNISEPRPVLKETAIRLIEISERIDASVAQFRKSRNQLIADLDEFSRLLDSLKEDVKKIVTANAN